MIAVTIVTIVTTVTTVIKKFESLQGGQFNWTPL